MPRAFCLAAAVVLLFEAPVRGQSDEGVARLLRQIGQVVAEGDRAEFADLVSPYAAPALRSEYEGRLFGGEAGPTSVRERTREHHYGSLPGDGYSLVIDVFTATPHTARIFTSTLDVRRASGNTAVDAWSIVSARTLTVVEGLHRLVLSDTPYTASGLTLTAPDLALDLGESVAYLVTSAQGPAGMIVLGRGEMRFTPGPQTERDQVRLLAGDEALSVGFDAAFVRMHPRMFEARGITGKLTPAPADARQLRRAREIFDEDVGRSFSLDLGDLSSDAWFILPPDGDFLAEVRTRGRGHLTYSRSAGEPEDVTLFERSRGRDIARYASEETLRRRGPSYDEDELADFEVTHYEIDATIDPQRQEVTARAELHVHAKAEYVSTLSLRLAEGLRVTSVTSPELGRLLHVRVRTRDTIILNLPMALRRGSEMSLVVEYEGRMQSQSVDQEPLEPKHLAQVAMDVPTERYFLLSGRGYWYPQPSASGHATAGIRITTPSRFTCVASGEPDPGRAGLVDQGRSRRYAFRATDPVRYLAVLLSRFKDAVETRVPLGGEPAAEQPDPEEGLEEAAGSPAVVRPRDVVTLRTVAVNAISDGRIREATGAAADLLRFYASFMGEVPYPDVSLAMVEHALPGGHSPGYFAMVHVPPPGSAIWRADPVVFEGFPEFFIAHEIAHQWWGQAVGWENYHEQWISEGIAQYFAAMYARERHGPEVFEQMLRQFRRWAIDAADQGPVYLGYRIGQIEGDRRASRAILYNKAAAVMHMLRRLVGDDEFFEGLRMLYYGNRFQKAGTADVRVAFETASGRDLQRFFDRWIRESRLPRVRARTQVVDGAVEVRLQQLGELIYDLPVTITIEYADGRSVDVVVPLTEAEVERRIPADGPVRQVRVNRDHAALALFE
ncbi:MAG: M1 family metallopeptidase [Acidimicrobiia bacterium]|nr:M1 family metallopeptidase [Acidimicrobiia bacterium]